MYHRLDGIYIVYREAYLISAMDPSDYILHSKPLITQIVVQGRNKTIMLLITQVVGICNVYNMTWSSQTNLKCSLIIIRHMAMSITKCH